MRTRPDSPFTPFALNDPATLALASDTARLLLRVTLGALLLLHGIAKLHTGPGNIIQLVSQAGLPSATAYLVYVGEVVAPLLLIAGWWTRTAAALVAVNMLFAIFLVHLGDLARLGPQGGWALELQAFYLVSAIVVALLGPGTLSLGERRVSSPMPRRPLPSGRATLRQAR